MTRTQSTASKRISVTRSIAAAACAVAVLVAPTVAGAASQEEPSVTIRYDRAALRDEYAAHELYARIRSAARRVCGEADMRELRVAQQVNRCRTDAVDRAVATIASPALGAVHRDRTGDDTIRLAVGG